MSRGREAWLPVRPGEQGGAPAAVWAGGGGPGPGWEDGDESCSDWSRVFKVVLVCHRNVHVTQHIDTVSRHRHAPAGSDVNS